MSQGGSDFNGFIWQQLGEMQRTLGAIQEAQKQLAHAQDKGDARTSSDLSAIKADLTEIKQIKHTAKWLLIIGTAIGGVLITVVGYIGKEVWDISKPLVIEKIAQPKIAPIPAKRP